MIKETYILFNLIDKQNIKDIIALAAKTDYILVEINGNIEVKFYKHSWVGEDKLKYVYIIEKNLNFKKKMEIVPKRWQLSLINKLKSDPIFRSLIRRSMDSWFLDNSVIFKLEDGKLVSYKPEKPKEFKLKVMKLKHIGGKNGR